MKRTLSPDELRLWHNQLKGVKPLSKEEKGQAAALSPQKPKPPQPQSRVLERKQGAPLPVEPLQDFGRKELRHLKIDGRLDMHGMTIDQGHEALERFLVRAQEQGFKIVLIITGKGAVSSENTLRHQLPRWIKETHLRHLVSFFHAPAKKEHGGQGACYLGVRSPQSRPFSIRQKNYSLRKF